MEEREGPPSLLSKKQGRARPFPRTRTVAERRGVRVARTVPADHQRQERGMMWPFLRPITYIAIQAPRRIPSLPLHGVHLTPFSPFKHIG